MLLALGHAVGWPVARGGSQAITDAMRAYLESLGGTVETGREVRSLADAADAARGAVRRHAAPAAAICGEALPPRYRRALGRYRYGPGVFKVDYALAGRCRGRPRRAAAPGPSTSAARSRRSRRPSGRSRRASHPERPYVLVAQQSLVDPTRAPAGSHTLWAYCHVPNGSTVDMTAAIERADRALRARASPSSCSRARRAARPQLEAENPNYIGGDINGGLANLRQVLARPVLRANPYATPNPRLFLCSSSTPPGGGVHGMCGYHAARAVLAARLK